MASKYAAILPKLPDKPIEDLKRQDLVNVVKAKLTENGIPDGLDLATRYANLRKQKVELEQQLSTTELAIEAISQMLVENQRSDDKNWGAFGVSKNSIRLPSGETIRIQPEPYAQCFDRDANREWAMQNGLERLLSINWQVLSSLTKERLLKGEPEPPGVKAYLHNKIIFSKAGGNDE